MVSGWIDKFSVSLRLTYAVKVPALGSVAQALHDHLIATTQPLGSVHMNPLYAALASVKDGASFQTAAEAANEVGDALLAPETKQKWRDGGIEYLLQMIKEETAGFAAGQRKSLDYDWGGTNFKIRVSKRCQIGEYWLLDVYSTGDDPEPAFDKYLGKRLPVGGIFHLNPVDSEQMKKVVDGRRFSNNRTMPFGSVDLIFSNFDNLKQGYFTVDLLPNPRSTQTEINAKMLEVAGLLGWLAEDVQRLKTFLEPLLEQKTIHNLYFRAYKKTDLQPTQLMHIVPLFEKATQKL